MLTFEEFTALALSFSDATVQPHFEKPSFRIGKKIFATYDARNNSACLKLNLIDQSVFSAFDPSTIFPVPNKWGLQGWTIFLLDNMRKDLLQDALNTAHQNIVKQ